MQTEQEEREMMYLNEQMSLLPRKVWYRKCYLESTHWQNLRQAKFDEVGKKCEVCGSEEHIRVHHLRYRNIFDVTTSDLQVLCSDHHRKAHALPPIKEAIRKKKREIEKITKAFYKALNELQELEKTSKRKSKIKGLKSITKEKKDISRARKQNKALDDAFNRMF